MLEEGNYTLVIREVTVKAAKILVRFAIIGAPDPKYNRKEFEKQYPLTPQHIPHFKRLAVATVGAQASQPNFDTDQLVNRTVSARVFKWLDGENHPCTIHINGVAISDFALVENPVFG